MDAGLDNDFNYRHVGCTSPAAARGHHTHASQTRGTNRPPRHSPLAPNRRAAPTARPPRDAAAVAALPGQEPCVPTGCTDPAPHQLAITAIGQHGSPRSHSAHPSHAFDPSLRPAPPPPGHLTSPAARTLLSATRS
ncbi:hypothetical protein PCL_02646 [Purpureocillium lilacinum]|uniref:Uncharacterized protein n=1 Tax=Purpureocillium lilacinum TaxID=33203 RepID=A0A2U3DZN8_PURLI|nr:hypothetical protein PCL_02646 [Purpureocillium lilacinum]